MINENFSILIIDNEPESLESIQSLLLLNQTDSKIITANNTNEAILKIINSSPDIVLINYPPAGNTEKELFELIRSKIPDACVAFVSDKKDYAKIAIQNGIYKYLLKPITEKAIKNLMESSFENKQSNIQYRLDQAINNKPYDFRLRLLTNNGYSIFSPDELLFCKTLGYYTELFFTNNKQELSSLTLTKIEEKLIPHGFIRISRTHIINPKHIKRVFRKGSIITLSFDGIEHEMKASKVLFKKLNNFDIE